VFDITQYSVGFAAGLAFSLFVVVPLFLKLRRYQLAFESTKTTIDHMVVEASAIQSKYEAAKLLADTHIAKNADFEQQSKNAWEMYRQAGLQAGHAQVWLMRELERSIALVNKYRLANGEEPLKVNDKLVEMLQQFKAEHANG
jgi:hypothetical protein